MLEGWDLGSMKILNGLKSVVIEGDDRFRDLKWGVRVGQTYRGLARHRDLRLRSSWYGWARLSVHRARLR